MAVFTPVTPDQAAAFLRGYRLGGLVALAPIAEGIENTNYRLTTADEGREARHVLTLFERRTDAAGLPFCLGLSDHLAARGFLSARPVRDQAGEWIGTLNGRPAAIVEWLDGAWLRQPGADQVEAAGATLAHLHVKGAAFPLRRDNPVGVAQQHALAKRCAERATGEDRRMLDALTAALDRLGTDYPAALPGGPVHGDYFPDNVLFHEGRISGVIDFYFAHTGGYAHDLGVALNAWGFDGEGRPDRAALSALMRGYQSVRPLSADEAAALPVLCAASAVRFTLTRLHDRLFHDPEWLVTPKDPAPFFERLAFHSAARPADYGLSAPEAT